MTIRLWPAFCKLKCPQIRLLCLLTGRDGDCCKQLLHCSYPCCPVSGATDYQASFGIDAVHLLVVAIELHGEVISSVMDDNFAIP